MDQYTCWISGCGDVDILRMCDTPRPWASLVALACLVGKRTLVFAGGRVLCELVPVRT